MFFKCSNPSLVDLEVSIGGEKVLEYDAVHSNTVAEFILRYQLLTAENYTGMGTSFRCNDFWNR